MDTTEPCNKTLGVTYIFNYEEDVTDTISAICDQCGSDLHIVNIGDEPEVGIIISVLPCQRCNIRREDNKFAQGYAAGSKIYNGF